MGVQKPPFGSSGIMIVGTDSLEPLVLSERVVADGILCGGSCLVLAGLVFPLITLASVAEVVEGSGAWFARASEL